jgi:hypothetical protein
MKTAMALALPLNQQIEIGDIRLRCECSSLQETARCHRSSRLQVSAKTDHFIACKNFRASPNRA